MKEQFASWAEFKDEVKLALGLESKGKLDDEWMLDVFLLCNLDQRDAPLQGSTSQR